jgi:hypothetical protein
MKTPAGFFFLFVRLTVPFAYIYMFLIILRELYESIPAPVCSFISVYLPYLAHTIEKMKKSSTLVEIWVFVETIFYILSKLHTTYLQYKDPLEASLSAAPILGIKERAHLWDLMMKQIMLDCPVSFIRGWFFDEPLENITSYDISDFCAWCMFEGRNQEHLTKEELRQLGSFVEELEWRISMYLHGEELIEKGVVNNFENSERETVFGPGKRNLISRSGSFIIIDSDSDEDTYCDHIDKFWKYDSITKNYCEKDADMLRSLVWNADPKARVKPRKLFHFQSSNDESHVFFSQLYENYKKRYEQYKHEMENFHPVQDMRNFMAEKRQRLHEVEGHAMTTASNMYENAYFSIIDRGSNVDKRLNAVSSATHKQLLEAWHSFSRYKEKLKMADFITSRRKKVQNQMKGYRALLDRMHSTSSTMPTKQMANLMNKITQCNESHQMIERSAKDAFMAATGLAAKNFFKQKEPKRYAKYTNDPLLGLATYPAMFHLIILGLTDGLLRVAMKVKGFERLRIGQTTYYYHPGISEEEEEESCFSFDDSDDEDGDKEKRTPIVFIHGIGIGLGYYLPLIDELVKLRRPIFLPEIPYVSGFRPWISRKSILTPAAAVSFLTQMLASHGYLKASFIGHSYGTSWLSYMCKYAPDAMCSLLFLDPICFCLHHPCLTKSFVYSRADPGSISYMIRTDVMINWTIQRSFPWSRIILFEEQIPDIPCSIYLSENDALIPFKTIEKYLRLKSARIHDFKDEVTFENRDRINVSVFRGMAHGDWCDVPSTATTVAGTVRMMTENYEAHR